MIKRSLSSLVILVGLLVFSQQAYAGVRSHGRHNGRSYGSTRSYYSGSYYCSGYPYYGFCDPYRYRRPMPMYLMTEPRYFSTYQSEMREESVQRSGQEVKKLLRNTFERVTVRVYIGSSPKYFTLKAGEEKIKEVPADSIVWAEAELTDSQGRKVLAQLTVGEGISLLPNDAGWVFHNPQTRR